MIRQEGVKRMIMSDQQEGVAYLSICDWDRESKVSEDR